MTGRRPEVGKVSASHGLHSMGSVFQGGLCGQDGVGGIYNLTRLVAVQRRHKHRHKLSA